MTFTKLVALRRHPFGTGEREKGEEYEATADEAKVLTALGWAAAVPTKKEPAKQEESTTQVKQEQKVPEVKAATPAKKTRGYQRRDMKAKD